MSNCICRVNKFFFIGMIIGVMGCPAQERPDETYFVTKYLAWRLDNERALAPPTIPDRPLNVAIFNKDSQRGRQNQIIQAVLASRPATFAQVGELDSETLSYPAQVGEARDPAKGLSAYEFNYLIGEAERKHYDLLIAFQSNSSAGLSMGDSGQTESETISEEMAIVDVKSRRPLIFVNSVIHSAVAAPHFHRNSVEVELSPSLELARELTLQEERSPTTQQGKRG